MKISVVEPLGLKEEEIRCIAKSVTDKGHELIIYNNKVEDLSALKQRVKDTEIIVLANMPLNEEVIKFDEKLKMISVAFTGVDHININTCSEKDVTICNAAGYSTSSVAELTYGLIFSLLRNINSLDKTIRESKTKAGYSQNDLSGKTIGIIGTGSIGTKVAEIAKVFGCNVLAYSRTKRLEVEKMGVKYVSLDELLKESDVVSIHIPSNDSTKGIISREKIALMKNTSILINTARGAIIDNDALAEALNKGIIAGAGIDVFDMEPPVPKDYPLLKAPNTVLTPHIGFATKEAMVRRAHITFDNIVKWLEGNPQNVVK